MKFDELENRYFELKGKHAAGLLSDEAFQAQVAELRTEDTQGRVWAIGADSGRWYVYQGGEWMEGEPPTSGAAAGGLNRGLMIGGIAAIGLALLGCLALVVYGVVAPGRPLVRLLSGPATETPTMQPVCTPPACEPDEEYYCPGECPGGCGIICVTVPPSATVDEEGEGAVPSATSTLQPVCTPPACEADEAYYCPDECLGGCGVVCATFTPTPQPEEGAATATATATPAASPTPELSPTPEASPTPRPPGLITGFETFGAWERGNEPHGTFSQQSDRVHNGSFAAVLDYDLPTGGNDFVVFMRDIPLGGAPNVIRIWVYEDGSGNFLNVWIKDAEGERWQATFGRLTGTGWRQREAIIQVGQPWPWSHIDGPSDGEIDYPITFNGLVLDGVSGAPRVGSVAIDDLTHATLAVVPNTPTPIGWAPATPTPCAYEPWGWFEGALMFTPGAQEKIGCPVADVRTLNAASQDFERGIMVWREDERLIYVLYDGDGWEAYYDEWREGMPEQDPAYGPPPEGLIQPKRGFGLVWQEHPSVRDRVGWGLNEERLCDKAHVQPFERGLMISCEHNVTPRAKIYVFILYDDFTYDIYMPG